MAQSVSEPAKPAPAETTLDDLAKFVVEKLQFVGSARTLFLDEERMPEGVLAEVVEHLRRLLSRFPDRFIRLYAEANVDVLEMLQNRNLHIILTQRNVHFGALSIFRHEALVSDTRSPVAGRVCTLGTDRLVLSDEQRTVYSIVEGRAHTMAEAVRSAEGLPVAWIRNNVLVFCVNPFAENATAKKQLGKLLGYVLGVALDRMNFDFLRTVSAAEIGERVERAVGKSVEELRSGLTDQVQVKERQMRALGVQLTEATGEYEHTLRQLQALTRGISLERTAADYAADIENLITMRKFTAFEIDTRTGTAEKLIATTGPIYVTHNGKRRYPMGKFRIEIMLPDDGPIRFESIRIYGERNYRGFCHPHVKVDGDVCWGGTTSRLAELCGVKNLAGVLDMVHFFLSGWNTGNPYCPLDSFFVQPEAVCTDCKCRFDDCPNGRTDCAEKAQAIGEPSPVDTFVPRRVPE